MKPGNFLLAALPVLALAVAGCGGGGNGGETTAARAPAVTETTPALSKAELISRGDAICAEVNAAVGTVSSTGSSAAGQATQAAQLYSGMVDRLKGLGQPEETAGYREFMSAAEELARAESDAKLAAERGDETGLATAEAKAATALASFQSAAQAYGFKECGEAPSAPTPRSTTPSAGEEAPTETEEATEAEAEPEVEAETGGAGSVEAGGESTGGGSTGGGTTGGGEEGGGSESGGIGPG